ncbi:MAG: hypothetical protein ACXVB9_05260 [Bdellovibrionota bacterium]
MKLFLLSLLLLSPLAARADDTTFVFPQTEGAGHGFAEIVAPTPQSAAAQAALDSGGNSATGFSSLPSGSSSLSTGGVASGVPEAGFTKGSSVTPSSPSSVPSNFQQ